MNNTHKPFSVVETICGLRKRGFGLACKHTLYNRWKHILERCYNPRRKDFQHYGAKGVGVVREWHEYSEFHKWFVNCMWRYAEKHGAARYFDLVIDRIDSDKDYGPDNCRLITVGENSRRAIKKRDKKGRFAV